jgi:hypothetical protein
LRWLRRLHRTGVARFACWTGTAVIAMADERVEATPDPKADSSREQTKTSHRVRLPRFVVQEPVGLGDVIKRGTTALGVQPCGGCQRRAAQLNRWARFEPRR